MARPKSIGLRPLAPDERTFLKKKLHDKTLAVRFYERYSIIAEAAQGREPKEIADRVGVHFTVVYD